MNYTFSKNFESLKPSAIREIFKYAADPQVVSLSAGNPAPDAFPVSEISDICTGIFASRPIEALQYNITEGYAPLRAFMKDYLLKKHALVRDFDELIITSGGQQVMELAAKVLCDDGDVIICENPSFIGSLNSFRGLGAKLVGVEVEHDGISIDALRAALNANPAAKIIYTIPNFQNPTGITMSLEKRKAVYALAREFNVLIIEDDPYGEIRFKGTNLPRIKSLDEDGRVIYAGSFSKVIAPGLRVAFALAPDVIIKKMVVAKQGEDVHTSILPQLICEEFLSKYDFESHLENIRAIYRRKAELTEGLLDEKLVPLGIKYNKIEGGLFFWCLLPENVPDMQDFCTRAVKDYKVAVVPGSAFLPDESSQSRCFRINYTTPSDENLSLGIERLGELLKQY